MQDDEVEAAILRRLEQAFVAREGHARGRLDAVRIPAAILQPIEKLSVTTPEVEHPGTNRWLVHGHMGSKGIEQAVSSTERFLGPATSCFDFRPLCGRGLDDMDAIRSFVAVVPLELLLCWDGIREQKAARHASRQK